jgi:signal transduction histidine kinase
MSDVASASARRHQSMPRHRRRPPPLWLGYLAGGAVVSLAYLLSPSVGWRQAEVARLLVYGGIGASAVACIVVGVRRYRPERLAPWYLLLAGQLLYLVADLTFHALHLNGGTDVYPSVADVLFLCHYPLVIAGVLALVRARTPGSDRVSLNDAAIIATGVGVVSWVFLVEPAVLAHGVPVRVRVVSAAYPIMDMLVLAAAARLIVGVGFRRPAFYLFVLSLLVLLATDTAYTALQLNGLYRLDSLGGTLLDAGWLTVYLLLGAAALHPSMRSLTERDHRATPRSGTGQLAFLAGASLLPPAVIVVQAAWGRSGDTWIIGIACMVLFLLVVLRMSGLVRMVETNAAQLRTQGAELQGTLEELERTEAERKQLLDKTVRGAEEERTRLAAELHDGPIQQLTAVGYRLEEAQLALEGEAGRHARQLLAGVQRSLAEEIGELRRLMAALRPPVLDERGLTLALRDHLETFERHTGTVCTLRSDDGIRLDPEVETVLYRVVQEALTNVAKHAEAKHVWVDLRVDDGKVDLQVRDDGVGFDATRVSGLVGAGHFGLAGMRERVEMAGGSHRLRSEPGDGTSIRVRLPRRQVPR